MYITIEKFGVSKIFLMFLKAVSYAQRGYIYSSSHYSSLQCHVILQKSFWYADLLVKKHFLLLSMLKTVLLLNLIVETAIFFSGFLVD